MERIRTAIVTGPTGAIGLALVSFLAQKQIETYAVCHYESKRNEILPENKYIHKICCNLDELHKLPDMVSKEIDVFFHLAWKGTTDRNNRMDMYLQNENVRYALDSVNVANALGCKVYIGAGSQAEFGRVDGVLRSDMPCHPENGYGMAKLCAEQMTGVMCRQYGIRHIWPRIISVYGPGDGSSTLISTIIREIMKNKIPKLTPGEQMWDYLYSKDAAEALYLMAECGRDGGRYVLGSGSSRPLKEYMEIVRNVVDPQASLDIGAIPYMPGQVMHLEADISDLTADTGFVPKTLFEDGIKEVVNEIRK